MKKEEIQKELQKHVDEYFKLYKDSSCLDGWFTADQLRLIAKAMDELALTEEGKDGIMPVG